MTGRRLILGLVPDGCWPSPPLPPARGRGRLPGLGGANGLHPGPGRGPPRRGAPVAPGPDRRRALPGGRGPAGHAQPSGHRLREGGVVRLDQNTTITFTPPPDRAGTWLDVLTGAAHFFTRTPRRLRITTPFVNGSVEGTEFLVEVEADRGAHLRVGGAGPRGERPGLPLARGRAVGGGARRAGPDAPADRREARRRRGLGSLLSPGPRPSPRRLPRPPRRAWRAAGPPLHRGSAAGRPRRRPGQRRGRPRPRASDPGCLRAPGRPAPRRGTSGRGRFPTSTGRWPSLRRRATRSRLRSVVALARNDRALARSARRAGRPGATRHRPPPAGALLRPAGGLRPQRRDRERRAGGAAPAGQCPGPCAPGRALALARRPRPRARGRRRGARASIPETRESRACSASPPSPRSGVREACRGLRARDRARSGGAPAAARPRV